MRYITTNDSSSRTYRSLTDTSWHVRGACHGMEPADAEATFFPHPRDHWSIDEAKGLCALCPVREECLDFALEHGILHGIWGGLTDRERRRPHDLLAQRLDYRRVRATVQGRHVHLTEEEKTVVIDHAYVLGWSPARLALALRIGHKHARDQLRRAAHRVDDRDRYFGVPRPPKRRPQTSPPRRRPDSGATARTAHAPVRKAA
ncbi:WhiB family transcriptional regulator [Streptomyces sp. P38-E01]|uniref:Transcriptional regulator WhiB n=1 Tax=Streptomyces tardus TaxID=2780544 RepID=A0A949N2H0_9ACTN|nr:WhiB family transcriptional regulator [Streptomyces tardus]MBU7598925.1 WhiB family transcriptional regulator [Streptomyces tardus]